MAPVVGRQAVRPTLMLQQMHEHQTQIAANGVEFCELHVLDPLDTVLAVFVIHPLSAREAAPGATRERRALPALQPSP